MSAEFKRDLCGAKDNRDGKPFVSAAAVTGHLRVCLERLKTSAPSAGPERSATAWSEWTATRSAA